MLLKMDGATAIETDIYMLGGSGSYDKLYIYDTLINDYIGPNDLPNEFVSGDANAIGKIIYVLGEIYSRCAYKYIPSDSIVEDNYKENIVYILAGETHTTKLLETSEINFDDAWLYKNGALQEYSTYIGNGTSWTKIKN